MSQDNIHRDYPLAPIALPRLPLLFGSTTKEAALALVVEIAIRIKGHRRDLS